MTVDLYPWFAVVSTLLIAALFGAHTVDAAYGYRRHHDDRASIELLLALTFVVASGGLACDTIARFVLDHDLAVALSNLGIGIVRGALGTTAAVLFLVDRRVLLGGLR